MRIAFALALVLGCSNNASHSSDAAIDAPIDAPSGPTFACGSDECALATQFCLQFESGRVPAVGENGCNTVPSSCSGAPTCDCVLAGETINCGPGLSCHADGSAIIVTCANP